MILIFFTKSFFCYKFGAVYKGYSLMFKSHIGKTWFDKFLTNSVIINAIKLSLLKSQSCKKILSSGGKEIFSTIIFPTPIEKTCPNHISFLSF